MRTDDDLTVLRPEHQDLRDGPVTLLQASETVGGWGAVIVRAGRGTSGRTHIHRGESEAFWIVEGEIELFGATSVTPLVPGTFVHVPPDAEHGLRVMSDRAAWLAIWPAALDGLVAELAAARADGRDDPETVADIRSRHAVDPGDRRIPPV